MAALLLQALSSEIASPHTALLLGVVAWPLSTWAGVGVLQQLLRGEVVYSTLAVIVLALLVAARRGTAEPQTSPAR